MGLHFDTCERHGVTCGKHCIHVGAQKQYKCKMFVMDKKGTTTMRKRTNTTQKGPHSMCHVRYIEALKRNILQSKVCVCVCSSQLDAFAPKIQ